MGTPLGNGAVGKTADETASRIAVEIAEDRLTAWIYPRDPDDPRPFDTEEIVAALREHEITVDEGADARVEAFLAMLSDGGEVPERFAIAAGKPAREGTDGEFLWDESLEKKGSAWQDDAPVNYYTLNSIVTVEQGRRIGTVIASTPGVDGFDVCGNKITPKKSPTEIQLDDTVALAPDDPCAVVANVAGRPNYEHGVVSIDEVLLIEGDVDFAIGNVDAVVAVHITGTIRDCFSVKSKKTVSVFGAIEAAEVVAQDDILVNGGIVGRRKGVVTAGRELAAKFCDEADLQAVGDVTITNGVINSHIRTEGKLIVACGALIGGLVYAREGVEVSTAGSEGCIPTTIIVGVHPDQIHEAEVTSGDLIAKRELARTIREVVQPIMAQLPRLSPEQRERATELPIKVDAVDAKIIEEEDRQEVLLLEGLGIETPYVLVGQKVYPGVVIRIGRQQVQFEQELAGPVRIEKRKIENVTEFVAVNPFSGSISVLKSTRVPDPETPNEADDAPEGSSPEKASRKGVTH